MAQHLLSISAFNRQSSFLQERRREEQERVRAMKITVSVTNPYIHKTIALEDMDLEDTVYTMKEKLYSSTCPSPHSLIHASCQ